MAGAENSSKEATQTPARAAFTVEELIRSQLAGKAKALELYDAILWKIRAGYLTVLYALLTVLSGKEFQLAELIGPQRKIDFLFYTAVSFSSCAFLLDLKFLFAKHKVVQARNRLSDCAYDLASQKKGGGQGELKRLLHLSGESPGLPKLRLFWAGNWPIVLYYFITPALVTLLPYLG